jgi:cell division protein FtsW
MSFGQRFSRWMGGVRGAGTAAEILPVRLGATPEVGRGRQPGPAARLRPGLVWVVVALLAFGLVMVYSASIAMPDNPKFARYAHTHFLTRHTLSLVMAFVVALLAFQMPVATWEKVAPWLFVVSLVLLMAVLIPHVGKGVNGARRWISLGVMNFQPSELAKFAVVLYAADYMVRKMEVKERFFRAVLPWAPRWLWSACCCWPSPTWAPSW